MLFKEALQNFSSSSYFRRRRRRSFFQRSEVVGTPDLQRRFAFFFFFFLFPFFFFSLSFETFFNRPGPSLRDLFGARQLERTRVRAKRENNKNSQNSLFFLSLLLLFHAPPPKKKQKKKSKMFRTVAASLAVLGLLSTASTAAAAPSEATKKLGKGFVMAKPGQLCPEVCAGAGGLKAATFAHLTTETAVCAANAGGEEGWVPGWSYVTFEGAPPSKAGCNVAANTTVPLESNDEYACLCMKDQIQGIDLPKGKPCSKACSKSITGRPGRAVSGNADGKNPGSACVSLPIELGELNRFGHVHEADDKW